MKPITLLEYVGELDNVRMIAHGVEPVELCQLLRLYIQRMVCCSETIARY